jgi:hypothetical protein
MSKRSMWESLVEVRHLFGDGAWCVIGDFNSVSAREESRGVNVIPSADQRLELSLFNNFVDELDREDVNLIGRNYTWYHPNEIAISVNFGRMEESLGEYCFWAIPRDILDHCSVVLKVGRNNWGTKQFCFNNFWLQNRKFKKVVEDVWGRIVVGVWMGFVLKSKLKGLKVAIKEWHGVEYGNMDAKVGKLKLDIGKLDDKSERGLLSHVEVESRLWFF